MQRRLIPFILILSIMLTMFLPLPAYAANQKFEDCNTYTQSQYGLYYAILEDGNLWEIEPNNSAEIVLENAVSVQGGGFGCIALKNDGTAWIIHHDGDECKKIMDNVQKIYVAPSYYSGRTADSYFVIRNDGSLWGWGENIHSLFGNSKSIGKYVSSPRKLMDNVSSISIMNECAAECVLAVKEDSSLWAWGMECELLEGFHRPAEKAEDYGSILSSFGDVLAEWTTSTKYVAPFKICDGVKSSYIVGNYSPQCAFMIMNNGQLWGFGNNSNYQLGMDNNAEWIDPTMILSGVRSVSVSSFTSVNRTVFALRNDNTLWTWGAYKDDDYDNPSYQKTPGLFTENIKYVDQHVSFWDRIIAIDTSGNYVIFREYEILPSNVIRDYKFTKMTIAATGLVMEHIVEKTNPIYVNGYVCENDRSLGINRIPTPNGLCIKSSGVYEVTQASDLPFTDMPMGDFYYDAVKWAYNNKVASGTTTTTFGPNSTTTRGQVVTFLWRAMGCPEPETKSNPFKDVKSNNFYYKAVLWAVENGITSGTTPEKFSPDSNCTNAHILSFIYRLNGEPGKSESPEKWYSDAVSWAQKEGLTDGTYSGSYEPSANCSRANTVLYLYRLMGNM